MRFKAIVLINYVIYRIFYQSIDKQREVIMHSWANKIYQENQVAVKMQCIQSKYREFHAKLNKDFFHPNFKNSEDNVTIFSTD